MPFRWLQFALYWGHDNAEKQLSREPMRKSKLGRLHKFDLEDSTDIARLENPKIALEPLEGLIIIDEIQRRPELFPILRVLVDQPKERKFLILGSASQELIRVIQCI